MNTAIKWMVASAGSLEEPDGAVLHTAPMLTSGAPRQLSEWTGPPPGLFPVFFSVSEFP